MPPPNSPQEGQRKLAAIMAADVAGYSRLMAEDERATVNALKQARAVFKDKVEAHQGRLIDTAGDSVLAEFRSVVEAVQCAVEVQAEIKTLNEPVEDRRRMYFRIGVNLGDVIEEADATIYGDGVNIAARLEALAEPGGVNVSGKVYDEVKGKLDDVGFGFLGEQDVKNIPEPVRAYKVLAEGETSTAEMRGGSKAVLRRPKVVAGLVAALAVVIGVAVWGLTIRVEAPQMVKADGTPTDDPMLAIPMGPSIAVLPFDNLSGDQGQDLFAEGLAADISRHLSLQPKYFVIGRGTTGHYKGRSIQEIGSELGVAFVVEGTVRKSGDTIRVTAALTDADNGKELWSSAYDRKLSADDFFEIQDEITNNIAITIGDSYGVIAKATRAASLKRGGTSLSGLECVLLAYRYFETISGDDHLRARDCLEGIVAGEPNYADAWGWLAILYSHESAVGYNAKEGSLDRALNAGQNAIEIDAGSQMAWEGLAAARFFRHEYEEFDTAARRALTINPNDAATLANMALYYGVWGNFDISLPLMEKVMTLSPYHQFWYHYPFYFSAMRNGQYSKALEFARKSRVPGAWFSHMYVAAALGQSGKKDEAGEEAVALLKILPTFPGYFHSFATSWNFPDDIRNQIVRGMEKAGIEFQSEKVISDGPSRPIIAVLPFDNMSGDPKQEYFADGITEDIITRLAQFPDILVLGRNTTFQFKDQAVDIKTIAEKLGADYVVEGSIRRGGDTVRVTAQLLGGGDWTHLWAETYDRALDPTNLFGIQDEITAAIAGRIGDPYGEVGQEEFRRSDRHAPKHVSSYDCVLRYFDYQLNFLPESFFETRDCLKKAVEIEPDYAEALAYLAVMYMEEISFGFDPDGDATYDEALRLLEKATALDPRSGLVRAQLALGLVMTNDLSRAVRELDEALRLAPNNQEVNARAIQVLAYMGEYERSDSLMDGLRKMNPNYPPWMNWMPAYGHLARGENTEAIALLEMTQMGWQDWTHAFIAAAHCLNGDIAEGRASLDVALEIDPGLADTFWSDTYYWQKGPGPRPMINAVEAGLEACGWDVPPDPGPEAFAPVQ
jgi:adenylate cyclase